MLYYMLIIKFNVQSSKFNVNRDRASFCRL